MPQKVLNGLKRKPSLWKALPIVFRKSRLTNFAYLINYWNQTFNVRTTLILNWPIRYLSKNSLALWPRVKIRLKLIITGTLISYSNMSVWFYMILNKQKPHTGNKITKQPIKVAMEFYNFFRRLFFETTILSAIINKWPAPIIFVINNKNIEAVVLWSLDHALFYHKGSFRSCQISQNLSNRINCLIYELISF